MGPNAPPRKTPTAPPGPAAARVDPIGCRIGLVSHGRTREECETHAEGLDGKDDGVEDEVGGEECIDGDRGRVGVSLGLGSVPEGEDDLKGEEEQI